MKYRVPITTNIQLFKYVEVEEATEEEAVAEVQRLIDEGKMEGLTAASVWSAIEDLRGPFTKESELDWTPGIIEDVDDIRIDDINDVIEVEAASI